MILRYRKHYLFAAVTVAFVLPLLSLATGPALADGAEPLLLAAAVTAPYWDYDAGSRVRGIATGDLDGDGQMEILVGTEKGELRVLRADGTLLWQYAVGGPVSPIRVVDLLGDGLPEVLVSDGTSMIKVLRGDATLARTLERVVWQWSPGTGILPADQSVTGLAVGAVRDVTSADLTGDGLPEILVGTDDFKVYALDFAANVLWEFVAEGAITSLSTADMDGDGRPEILVSTLAGYAHALGYDGQVVWRFNATDGVTTIAAADLDTDGVVEILVGSRGGVVYALDLRRWLDARQGAEGSDASQAAPGLDAGGQTTFVADQSDLLWMSDAGSPVQSLDTGNLDEGDSLEVVVGSQENVTVLDAVGGMMWQYPAQGFLIWARVVGAEAGRRWILTKDDAGASILRKSSGVVEQAHFYGSGPHGLAVFSDINGDNFGEVIVAVASHVRLFGYDSWQAVGMGLRWAFPTGESVATADLGDVNGDGLLELAAASFDQNVYILREGKTVIPALTTGGSVNVVHLADLNGDGSADVLAGSTDWLVYAFRGQGAPLWQTATQGEIRSVTTGSWDVIEQIPAVLAGSGDGSVYALRAYNGEVIWQFATGGPVSALAVADMDGNVGYEVVTGSGDGAVYALQVWDGEKLWQYGTSGPVMALATADVDDDGLSDVVVGSDAVYALTGVGGELLWQYAASPSSLAVADLDGDGGVEVLVGSPDGKVYALGREPGRSDRVVWQYDTGSAVRSVASADLDGDALPEVLVGTRDGSVHVLQSAGESGVYSLNRYSVGGGVTRVAGADMDGDGLAEIVVTSNDGQVYLFGLVLNQPPLLVNASYERAAAGWAFSVDVIDPEGDEFDVQLEILDPAGPPWKGGGLSEWVGHGPKHYAGEGGRRLSWYVSPFDWWDRGLDTRFRLVFSNPDVTGTLREIGGPPVPGPRWQVVTIPPLLGALLVLAFGGYRIRESRRRWAQSPAGQAQQLYQRVVRNPEGFLAQVRRVIAESDRASRILSQFHLQCDRQGGRAAWGDVAQGYALMLSNPELLEGGLTTLISGLSGLDGVEGQEAALATYELLGAGMKANSVPRIAALRSQIEWVRTVALALPEGLLELARVVELWLQVADSLQSYEKVQATEEKIRFLGRAVESLGRLERDVRRAFVEPERSLIGEVAGRWLTVVNNALSEVRGRAELRLALKTRQVLAVGDVSLVLELGNEGNAPAENVRVELRPSKQYEILEGVQVISLLSVGRTELAEVRLRPRARRSFRARFQITFDDEQQKGRTLPFADEVSLVMAEAEFQPIVNPYYAGRPLETGSPLFVGREDVFDFIKQNLRGRFQDNVLVLIGQRRTGKTSLLKQLPVRLGEEYVPVYVDGQQLGIDPGMVNFFYGLSRIIARELRERGVTVTPPPRAEFEPAPAAAFKDEFLAAVQKALGERRLVLSFDEFEELENRVRDGKLDSTIFPFMRHLMQHGEKLAFIFVGTHRLEQLSGDYWSIFFNIALYRDIRFLDEDAARRLIIEPVREYNMIYDDLAVDRILDITARHPYFLQLMCHALVNFHNSSRRNYITVQDVRDVVGEIIGLGEAHFNFIWTTASRDERLTLAALTRLLAEQTMVTSSDVASKLAEYGQKADPTAVSAVLGGLADQDIVREIRNHVTRYNCKLDLVRLWVERYKPLSAVVEEVTHAP